MKHVHFILIFFFGTPFFIYGQSFMPEPEVTRITSSEVDISWNKTDNASSYKLFFRVAAADLWNFYLTSENNKNLKNLLPATGYEIKVAAIFPDGDEMTSGITSFETGIPKPDHIVMLILENHGFRSIVNAPAAPYINSLIRDSMTALFTHSYGITHPSQPNYIHLFSGGNQGVKDNGKPHNTPFSCPNLFGYFYQENISFSAYSEDLPYTGFDGEYEGEYARKHNPVTNWIGTGINRVPPGVNMPFSAFPADFNLLPEFCYVIPNQDNDMHNGTSPANIIKGDNWIKNYLDQYIQWARHHNSLFILTYDEDNYLENNSIPTLFFGPMVKGGVYADSINHHNMLRTLAEIYNLPHPGKSSTSRVINCWKNKSSDQIDPSSGTIPGIISAFTCLPIHVTNRLTLRYEINTDVSVGIIMTDMNGNKLWEEKTVSLPGKRSYEKTISTEKAPEGIYFIKLTAGSEIYNRKIFIYH